MTSQCVYLSVLLKDEMGVQNSTEFHIKPTPRDISTSTRSANDLPGARHKTRHNCVHGMHVYTIYAFGLRRGRDT